MSQSLTTESLSEAVAKRCGRVESMKDRDVTEKSLRPV